MPSVRARPWGVRVGQVKPRQKIGIDLQIVIQTQRAAYWVARGHLITERSFRAWSVLLKPSSLLLASGQLETLSKTEREDRRKGEI
jgi:hypothetical protein